MASVIEDFERCYRAVQSRDARFDGWFFTAVTSTLSDAVRPKRSGQYMSSTLACGRT